MKALVTGGAGFVGATLVERLLADGHSVVAVDNFRRGRVEYVRRFIDHPRFRLLEADVDDERRFTRAVATAFEGGSVDEIWHLAANSDIPAGIADPRIDLRDTFMTTFSALVVARAAGIRRFLFASSSAIYGDLGDVEIAEDAGPLLPISNYGAMKLASEAQIAAAAETFLASALIFRFPNVVGVPATHGVILDFVRKLKANPRVLDVLGDGTQRKAYLHVSDLVDAMVTLARRSARRLDVFNIGPTDDGVLVSAIAEAVVARVAPGAEIRYGTGNRGWVGDVPRFRYSVRKLVDAGWTPRLASADAVRRAIDEIARQEGFP